MALKDNNKVPTTSYSSCDDHDSFDNDCDDDDESSIMSFQRKNLNSKMNLQKLFYQMNNLQKT